MSFLESLIASAWNCIAARKPPQRTSGPQLDLGFRVVEGEVNGSRAHLAESKRCEHVAILGKTGQGKSFFLRHLAAQDIRSRRGFACFDMHGDMTPFLLKAVAAEERRSGADLSDELIVIEPGDP